MEIARWAQIPKKKKGPRSKHRKNHENLRDLRNLHRDSREPNENHRDPKPRRGLEVPRTSERSKKLRKDRESLVRKNYRENWEINSHWRREEIEKRETLVARGDPKGTESHYELQIESREPLEKAWWCERVQDDHQRCLVVRDSPRWVIGEAWRRRSPRLKR